MDEFRHDATRIALTNGLTEVADDLGVGMSSLNEWITARRDTGVVSAEDLSLAHQNGRLRYGNRLLMDEQVILNRRGSRKAPVRPFPR